MRRPLLIALIVSLVAMGGIGAAFATDMDITGMGALSSGTGDVPGVNVVRIDWSVGGDAHDPIIDNLCIVFDKDLIAIDPGDTPYVQGEIMIDFQNVGRGSVGMFHCGPELCDCTELLTPKTCGNPICLDVSSANADPHEVEYIKITYAN